MVCSYISAYYQKKISNECRKQSVLLSLIKESLYTCSFTDDETEEGIKELISELNYIPDPHGAVGYLGAKDFIKSHPNYKCIILETAHPAKFSEVINLYTNNLEIPSQIISVMDKKRESINIDSYLAFKNYLLDI